MRAKITASLAALAMSAICFASPPTLNLPKELRISGDMIYGELKFDGEYKFISYEIEDKCAIIKTPDPKVIAIVSKTPGTYTLRAVAGNEEGLTPFITTRVVIGEGNPVPAPPIPTPIPPVPIPTPTPTPTPTPDNNYDPILLLKIKEARARDASTGIDIRKAYEGLANAYLDSSAILSSTSDPALRPKTWGELLERLKIMSIANNVPLLPNLQYTRNVLFDYVGTADSAAAFDDTLLNRTLDKFPKVGATLREANK